MAPHDMNLTFYCDSTISNYGVRPSSTTPPTLASDGRLWVAQTNQQQGHLPLTTSQIYILILAAIPGCRSHADLS